MRSKFVTLLRLSQPDYLVSNAKDSKSTAPSPQSAVDVVPLAEWLKAQQAEPEVQAPEPASTTVPEIGGRKDGPDPTRYGDWEKNGRCIDF